MVSIPAGLHAIETDASDNPLHRGVLGVHGEVVETEHYVDCIEECGWLTSRRVRHIRSPSWCPETVDNEHGAKVPENLTHIV
jgi:hypothetical protein